MTFDDTHAEAIVAAAEIVGRAGGKQFEVGYLYDDETPPPGWPEGKPVTAADASWYATARWNGALLKGEGDHPAEACERLAARILHGGQCVACGNRINLIPGEGRWPESEGNCNWYREGKHWLRGCDGGYETPPLPPLNRKMRRQK
jgi:hypothetical protein